MPAVVSSLQRERWQSEAGEERSCVRVKARDAQFLDQRRDDDDAPTAKLKEDTLDGLDF